MTSRQIKIKTAVVQRLIKEDEAYKKEYEDQRTRVELLIAQQASPNSPATVASPDGVDGAVAYVGTRDEDDGNRQWNIRKQKEVLEETKKMIPDVHQRLAKAVQDLTQLIEAHESEIEGTDELRCARQVLSQVPPASTTTLAAVTPDPHPLAPHTLPSMTGDSENQF